MRLLVNHTPGKVYLSIVDFWTFFYLIIALLRIKRDNKLSIKLEDSHFLSNLFFHGTLIIANPLINHLSVIYRVSQKNARRLI